MRFDGDMRSTILHYTMKFDKDTGWKPVTTGVHVLLLQHNKRHEIMVDSQDTQEANGHKQIVMSKQHGHYGQDIWG